MATLDRRYNILDMLVLTDETNNLDTRFQEVEVVLQGQPQLRSTLHRFRTSLQGFRNWRNSLLAFNGNISQTGQALLQQEAAVEQLEQLDSNLLNLSQQLTESAGIRDIPSGQLLSDVVELDVAVGRLIALFPGARPEAANVSLNQAQPSSRPRQQAWRNLAPLDRTDSAPPNLDEQAEAEDSVPTSFPPPPRSASTGFQNRYVRINARGNSVGQAGDIIDTSASADASSTPQSPASGTCYDVIDISENATFHAGNVYRHGSNNTVHPMQNYRNPRSATMW